MISEPISFTLGDTAVTIFTISHLMADLAEWYHLLSENAVEEVRPFLERPLPLSIQSILIKQDDWVVLVDAPEHDIADNSVYVIPSYEPPPRLVDQLAQVGIVPDDVTHVIITHPHFDHFNALTIEGNALFPQARHYLAQADWKSADMQAMLAKSDSLESKTFGFLHQQGMLELVKSTLDFGNGAQILPAPGETPGHQIVRIESYGQVLYCVGDLFHHVLELRMPGTAVHWANPIAMTNSQQHLIEAVLTEDALLIACHISGYGRIIQTDAGLIWQTA